jgi:nicotinate-nucleotide adenylyltransferase
VSNAKPILSEEAPPLPHPPRIGLYGGSFDPIHHGHLILAREARELLGLERVIFLPARLSPHKLDRPPANAQARWQMLVAALEDEEGFFPDDRELLRQGPSYAIETVREIEREIPGAEIYYLIGEDNVAELGTWKESDELVQRVRMVVLGRRGQAPSHPWPIISRQVEISSTEIRNRVAQGRSVRYLMPEMSRQILLQNSLYSADHG